MATRIVAVDTTTTGIPSATLLIERHSPILIINAVGLVRVDEIHQHVVSLAHGFGVFANSTDKVILGSCGKGTKSFGVW